MRRDAGRSGETQGNWERCRRIFSEDSRKIERWKSFKRKTEVALKANEMSETLWLTSVTSLSTSAAGNTKGLWRVRTTKKIEKFPITSFCLINSKLKQITIAILRAAESSSSRERERERERESWARSLDLLAFGESPVTGVQLRSPKDFCLPILGFEIAGLNEEHPTEVQPVHFRSTGPVDLNQPYRPQLNGSPQITRS